MKISYDPSNLYGAEHYMKTMDRTADTSSHRRWIVQATAKMLVEKERGVPEFAILHRGLGFFWEEVGNTSAPLFAIDVPSNELPDLIEVSYWVAADAIPKVLRPMRGMIG